MKKVKEVRTQILDICKQLRMRVETCGTEWDYVRQVRSPPRPLSSAVTPPTSPLPPAARHHPTARTPHRLLRSPLTPLPPPAGGVRA